MRRLGERSPSDDDHGWVRDLGLMVRDHGRVRDHEWVRDLDLMMRDHGRMIRDHDRVRDHGQLTS